MHYLNMALIDKASLLFVPSVVAQEKAFNILPSGNRAPDSTGENSGYDQTRADFTFDRGSNAAATRVNSDGLIEKYRENLLLQSNQFDTTWGNSNTTETGGQADKDGGNTAWRVDTIAAAGRIQQSVSTSGVQTFSVYAKAGTYNFIDVVAVGGSVPYGYFDLSTGTIGSTNNIIDANIEDVGGGWYRCSITFNDSAVTSARFYPVVADNDLTGTSGNIYIQSAQLESGLVATDYLDSGATTAKAGVLIDLPRINYDANGENGALLLEPSRLQMTEYSEYFEGWSRVNSNVAVLNANTYTSPEGVDNAYKVTFTEGGGQSQIYKVLNGFTIGTKYTQSIYLKYISGSGENFQILKSFGTAGVRCTFTNDGADLSVIAVGGTQADDFGKEPLANGWFRIWFTYESNTTNWEINISRNTGSGSDVYAIYGHQLEAGSYATSYIPNHGTSGGVTRAADSLFVESLADELTTGYTEATLYLEFKYKQESAGDAFVFGQDNGTYPAGRGYLYNKQVGFADTFGGGGFSDLTEDTTLKLIYRLNSLSNADVFLNATKGTNVSGTAWSAINQIRFRGTYCRFEISEITMFNEALTDAECITLTTL